MTSTRIWNAVGAFVAPFVLTTVQLILWRASGIEWLNGPLLFVNSLILGLIFLWYAWPGK